MSVLKKVFSRSIYVKRKELKFSQEVMAEKCCISTRQYIDLERGKRLPTFQTFVNIVIILELDFNTLILTLLKNGYSVTDKDDSVA